MTTFDALVGGEALGGLSQAEAQERRGRGLGNPAPPPTGRTYPEIVRENVFPLTNNLMYVLGLLLALSGSVREAAISVLIVSTNAVVGTFQEVRAKRQLDRIALLSAPRASVLRDGAERQVTPQELVVGDVLVLRPGDQIVLDGALLAGRLEVDESLLTGESDLVRKLPGDPVYSGSFCVTGEGRYEAQKVGSESFANQITASARAFKRQLTPLQKQVNVVIRVMLVIVAFFEALVLLTAIIQRLDPTDGLRQSVVIAGLIPNGLFVAIAVAYSLGSIRLSGRGALVQQFNAIESLSNVDVLCLDKTGTLTSNSLQVAELQAFDGDDAALQRALGVLAASSEARNKTAEAIATAFPADAVAAADSVPFSSQRKWSAVAFAEGELAGAWVLGAPEIVGPHTAGVETDRIAGWTNQGFRVLLLARAPATSFAHDGDYALPDGLRGVGLVAFRDELRPEAQRTLRAFARAGITIKIISGDNPDTVAALARQAGLPPTAKLVAGHELEGLTDAELEAVAEDRTIFGRITPGQKEQIVRALRRRGHYVAMTGDGVNDVLSLKRADLGIAMESGSQAARGVAGIILLGDSFGVLPAAFREGQRIVNGMEQVLRLYLLRVTYVTLLILAAMMLGGFPLAPIGSNLVALLAVGIPSFALTAWARPGKPSRQSLVLNLARFVVPTALSLTLFGVGVFLLFFLTGNLGTLPEVVPLRAALAAQTAVAIFSTAAGIIAIALADLYFISGRRWKLRRPSNYLMLGLLALLIGIIVVPFGSGFFDLSPLPPLGYAALALAVLLWTAVTWAILQLRLFERTFLFEDARAR